MTREDFDDYVRRFNAEDPSGFERYLAPDVTVQNGRLHYQGVQGMIDHYAKIWGKFRETLHVKHFVADGDGIAVHLWTHFDVLADDPASLFGSVRAGESFDYDGVVLYRVADGKIRDIKVSYLDFVRTDLNGVKTSLGIVH
jgi:hypothetical protein